MVHLDYRDARPIYSQIIDGFRQQICSGILSPGDRMPSVRDLATQLTINPNTIQRAYRELESQGWIVSIPGKGSFVCDAPQQVAPERAALLQQFDELVTQLENLGFSREMLAERLTQGGNTYA